MHAQGRRGGIRSGELNALEKRGMEVPRVKTECMCLNGTPLRSVKMQFAQLSRSHNSTVWEAPCRVKAKRMHSAMLSIQLFFGLPSTVPCRSIILMRPSDLVTCPYHFSFRRFTVAWRSSYGHDGFPHMLVSDSVVLVSLDAKYLSFGSI